MEALENLERTFIVTKMGFTWGYFADVIFRISRIVGVITDNTYEKIHPAQSDNGGEPTST